MNNTEEQTNKTHGEQPADQLLRLEDHHNLHDDPESVRVFLQRVGKMPLVSGVVRAYERGKDTSKMVKYGADLVESSVNSLSDTVVSRVGPERIAQIDRYAGAALDRLGQFSQPHVHYHHHHHHHHYLDHFNPDQHAFDHHSPPWQRSSSSSRLHQAFHSQATYDDQVSEHSKYSNSSDSFHQHPLPNLAHAFQTSDDERLDRSTSPGSRTLVHVSTTTTTNTSRNSKSRWQNILVEAGMTAGGIGAAVSEESMKSLQYCLHWLHYATAHLDHQITVLSNLIGSLNEEEEEEEESLTYGMRTMEAVTRLAGIKKEVVETIRNVVDVVSKYARVGLPEPAKQFVRKSILGLPLRWASAIRVTPFINYSSSHSNSGEGNPSPIDQSHSHLPHANRSHPTFHVAAHRVLTFAVESLNMLKSITGTFSESVERADAWVQRLRVIGFQNRTDQHPGHDQEPQWQPRWENVWKDMEEDEEERSIRGTMDKNRNLTRRKDVKPRSKSLGRFQPNPRVRSRSSSGSSSITFEEDNISEKSMMSSSCCGCDLSTVGSLISSNTTLTPSCSSNNNQFTHQDLPAAGSLDRSAAKRRKANGKLTHHLHPIILDPHASLSSPSNKMKSIKICSSPFFLDDDEDMRKEDEEMYPNEMNLTPSKEPQPCHHHSLSDAFILNTPPALNSTHSNSLKKILLDSDQVNHLDSQLSSHAASSSPTHIRLHQNSS